MSDLHRTDPTDMTVQPDQGPFHETPEDAQAQSQTERPTCPDADQDTGVDRETGADASTGDPHTPGESVDGGNAQGLTQGLDS